MILISDTKQFSEEIVRTLRGRGHAAYLVGGCVRDILLSREAADYDVATSATPEQVMDIFPQTWAVGAQFGVVLVPSDSGTVEVATFRSDIGYSDGRHPDEVRFSSDPCEDVQRRDFTINGLLLDPESNEILDYVGGAPICPPGLSEPSEIRNGALPKTSYACCGRCVSLHDLDMKLSPRL